MPTVSGREKERSVHDRLIVGLGAGGSRRYVLDEPGTFGRAVALPQLDTVRPIVGYEKERPAPDRQIVGIGGVRARVYILDELGSRGRAVAPPELRAYLPVVGSEQHRLAYRPQRVRMA